MEVWATIEDVRMPLAAMAGHARRAEALGYDGLVVPEAVHDAILGALVALEHTERLRVATGVVVAFARSPMLLAQDAWALQQLSGGRFELGLGPQVRGNLEERFGVPWSAPAPRMRDYVGALRAVFTSWQERVPLRFESTHYRLTRMQPFFDPGPIEHPRLPILIGAIGPSMTRVAGEVADRLITHPTNSDPEILARVVRPALDEGAARAGRPPRSVGVMANPLTATGRGPAEVRAERARIRAILAFLYSTPAYRASLEHHGWAEVGERLHRCSREGHWAEMPGLLSEEMLDRLVPSAPFGEVASLLRRRYEGVAEAITLRMPHDPAADAAFAPVLASLRGGEG